MLISHLLIVHMNLLNDILIFQTYPWPCHCGQRHKNAGVFSRYNKPTIKAQVCGAGLSRVMLL